MKKKKLEEQKNAKPTNPTTTSSNGSTPGTTSTTTKTENSKDSGQNPFMESSDSVQPSLSNSTNDLSSTAQPVYDPASPYDFSPGVSPPVVNHRVFSGCVAWKGSYYAVDQQGTIIDKFSKSDCRKIIDKSYNRPFDYFNARKQPEQPKQEDKDNDKTKLIDQLKKELADRAEEDAGRTQAQIASSNKSNEVIDNET